MKQAARILLAIAEKRWRWVVAVTMILLLGWAWSNRFIQDDAFISFRYARNLAEGQGLTWNAGERVEGYTNFLWVLLMTLPIKLGLDPVWAAYALGMLCFAGSLVLTFVLARDLLHSRWRALIAVALLGLNYTFSAYATGGLETQLQACALLGAAVLAVRVCAGGCARFTLALLGVSLCASVALLTRLDSAVVLAPLYVALLVWWLRCAGRKRWRYALALGAPALVLVGGWLVWKQGYYGSILPNTFYAKAASPSIRQGFAYAYRFVTFYWLGPVIAVGVLYVLGQLRRRGAGAESEASEQSAWHRCVVATLAACVGLWFAYVVGVGGDFMEFRFFVAILPLTMVLAVWMIWAAGGSAVVRAGLVLALAVAGVLAAWGHKGYGGVESIAQLQGHLSNSDENWSGIGHALGVLLPQPEAQGVVIATTAAGAIPYYSRLDTIDMLGLNDAWVAREGTSAGARAGHQKLATFEYLVRREVTLVLGHPRVAKAGVGPVRYTVSELDWFTLSTVDGAQLPETARVLEIPLPDGYALRALYLMPHPAVEQTIAAQAVTAYPIVR